MFNILKISKPTNQKISIPYLKFKVIDAFRKAVQLVATLQEALVADYFS